jgi:hypothetical protein
MKGSNGSLESIYNEMMLQQGGDFLAGATSATSDLLGLVWKEESLLVQVTATGKGAETLLAHTVEAYGVEMIACSEYSCSCCLPMINFPAFSADDNIKIARPSMSITQQAGSKVSEALKSLRVDLVRDANATLTGQGLKIGILSDSFNRLNGYAADIASSDLPNDVTVLKEFSGTGGTDGGRGMAQLVHDLIPGAKLFFRTAFEGADDFALGIQELADAGCDVIVDDVSKCIRKGLFVHASQNPILTRCQLFYSGYPEQPFFQDGVIAQAANDVAEMRGVPYFSAAGNFAKNSWQGTFQGSGSFDDNGCELHAFAGGDTRQSISINAASRIVFQWQDPFFSVSGGSGASRDMDFRVYFNGTILAQDVSNDQGIDPVAFIAISQTGIVEFEFSLCTPNTTTPPPLMKWIASGSVSNIEFDTQSSTSFGHPNQAFTAGVGAAFFQSTPAFGTNPPQLESFSSRGGTPILFTRSGAPTNETRMQPRFVATDGCINTFLGQFEDILPNGPGFYFFGMFLHCFATINRSLSHFSCFA